MALTVVLVLLLAASPARSELEDPSTWLWETHHSSGPGTVDEPSGMVLSPDGSLAYVQSVSRGGTSLLAVDVTSGRLSWSAIEPMWSWHVSPTLADGGNSVVVTGQHDGTNGIATVAYDARTGSVRWRNVRTGLGGWEDAHALAEVPDVGVVVAGEGAGTEESFLLVALGEQGATLWEQRIPGVTGSWTSIAVGGDRKTVFVDGSERPPEGAWRRVLRAFDARTGEPLWTVRHDDDPVGDLALSPDGSLLLQALLFREAGSTTLEVSAYETATGRLAWTSRLDGKWGGEPLLAIGPDDRAYVIANSDEPLGWETGMVALSVSSGRRLWKSSIDSGGEWLGVHAVALSPAGDALFAVGSYDDGWVSHWTQVLLAIETTWGRPLWQETRHEQEWSVSARGVAVTPDGDRVLALFQEDEPGGIQWKTDAVIASYRASSCASGASEDGPVSSAVGAVEHRALGVLHTANCAVLADNGL